MIPSHATCPANGHLNVELPMHAPPPCIHEGGRALEGEIGKIAIIPLASRQEKN